MQPYIVCVCVCVYSAVQTSSENVCVCVFVCVCVRACARVSSVRLHGGGAVQRKRDAASCGTSARCAYVCKVYLYFQ